MRWGLPFPHGPLPQSPADLGTTDAAARGRRQLVGPRYSGFAYLREHEDLSDQLYCVEPVETRKILTAQLCHRNRTDYCTRSTGRMVKACQRPQVPAYTLRMRVTDENSRRGPPHKVGDDASRKVPTRVEHKCAQRLEQLVVPL